MWRPAAVVTLPILIGSQSFNASEGDERSRFPEPGV